MQISTHGTTERLFSTDGGMRGKRAWKDLCRTDRHARVISGAVDSCGKKAPASRKVFTSVSVLILSAVCPV